MKSKRGRPPVCDWDAQPLGQVSDRRLAETLGVTTAAVQSQRAKRGIPPCPGGRPSLYDWTDYDHLLGTVPDSEVAEQVGCSKQAVHQRRVRLGIPACTPLYDWTDYDHLLGTMPDREVAEIVGCALSTAHHRRKSLGIPAHGRGRS